MRTPRFALITCLAMGLFGAPTAAVAANVTTSELPVAVATSVPAGTTPRAGTMPDSPVLLGWPIVRRGASGHPVTTLQLLLRAHGRTVVPDGSFGPRTDAAVRAFQRSEGLTADGIVGPLTWSALVVPVSRGSRGDAVRAVQEEDQFRNLSGDRSKGLTVDGIFGPRTAASVRAFQQALGVRADGVVGPLTWRGLVSGMYSF